MVEVINAIDANFILIGGPGEKEKAESNKTIYK